MSRLSVAAAALLTLVALPASAQEAGRAADAPPAGDEVLVSAARLERQGDSRVVVGEGTVVVRHRELRLAADRAVYNEGTKDLVADGNVVLDSGADRLQGEHLELNLGTRIGFVERGQGFVQGYYLTGARIEKQGPDRYFVRRGTFTTCEGVLPDWSFHATSADVTIDEYLHAWNPSLHVKRLPVLYFPYAVFPVKRDRSTGLLIPGINYSDRDGLIVRNAFYWAPRDNFDVTLGLDSLQNTGWGANGELRYLLAPRTQGILNATYLQDRGGTGGLNERWSVATRNSHELPLGLHLEAEAFFQSDRRYTATYGNSIEERSNERTTTSAYLNRSWSSWDFTFSGRHEESLLTEQRTTLTRFPELTVDRTSARLFGTDLLLKLDASGARLRRENANAEFATTRLHLAPEVTWPFSLGSIARFLPSATYAVTHYSEDLRGGETTREVPTWRLTLEGPRIYRVWDLAGGEVEKLKHLIEPSIGYVQTPQVDQRHLPQFDSLDRIEPASRLEYSLTNTLYAKVLERRGAPGVPRAGERAGSEEAAGAAVAAPVPLPAATTREMLWVKLSQNYSFRQEDTADASRPFSPVEWEARSAPGRGLELAWRGDYDVYGDGVGYQDVSLRWSPSAAATVSAEWRTTRDSNQDFLDLGGELSLGRIELEGRSRYNLAEETFVENRVSIKFISQCWDVTLSYVRWTDTFSYSLLLSLKGIGTVVKI
ncbi:MAG TPA: LPS assembly protein LptD [Candidatus Methanoperedens sp.]|nr:LPS assembly protein LptD [Candidatus Methanoperedens sp.]